MSADTLIPYIWAATGLDRKNVVEGKRGGIRV
jgi:hypothetical protein